MKRGMKALTFKTTSYVCLENLTSVVNIGHLCYTLVITVACILVVQYRKWPGDIFLTYEVVLNVSALFSP
jgi:hypothetical protein